MNSLFVIAPYRHHGMWVFDDPVHGLVQEPFVAGADAILDLATEGIANAELGFRMIFSADRFPGANLRLRWVRAEMGGNVYYCDEVAREGWLCPALFKYFPEAPRTIFAKCEALPPSSASPGKPQTLPGGTG